MSVNETVTRAAARPRDPYFDNVRALLITLVVIGHLFLTIDAPPARVMTTFIYSFHMPAFVFVTGYLSRRYTGTPREATRLISTLAVPYLIFQTIHATLDTVIMGRPFDVHVFQPAWTLWFLVGLLVWRIVTPLLKVLRYPMTVAVLASLLVPLSPGLDQTWSMSRILGFLPFYVLGLVIDPAVLHRVRSGRWRVAGGAVLLVLFILAFQLSPGIRASNFYMDASYAEAGMGPLLGMGSRALSLLVGLVGTMAVLAITTSRQGWISRLGRYSLFVYLLHPMVLYPAQRLDVLQPYNTVADTVWLTLAAIALTCVLASPPVVWLTRWIVQPRVNWLAREQTPPRA